VVVVWPLFLRIFVFPEHQAICLWPFIVLKNDNLKKDRSLINHERIHWKQQLELLIVFFYLIYVAEYLYLRLLKRLNHAQAYRNISFEKEAYEYEAVKGYLKNRRVYNQWRSRK
jgi:hypothetical protein